MSRNPKNAPAKSKSPLPFIIIGAVLVAVTAAVVLMSRNSASNSGGAPATNSNAPLTPRTALQPGAPNPWAHGSETARITLEEFSDFQCPACAGLEPGLRRVLKDYEARGVRLIFRNYPLQMHKYAF